MPRPLPKFFWSVFLAAFMAMCPPAHAREAMDHLRALCASPDRGLGTAGERLSADYVESVFTSLPKQLQAVTGRQKFTTPVRNFHSALMRINGREVPIRPLYANAVAPETLSPEGVNGPVIHVGKGGLENFDGKKVAGSIVLMDLDSGSNWLHAANLGAKALVYLDKGETNTRKLHFRDKEEVTPLDFPRFWIRSADFTATLAAPASIEGSQAFLSSRTEWVNHLTDNVYCFIPGQDPKLSGEVLLIESFLDATRYVPGHAPGADEGVSLATLLQVAENFVSHPPRRSVLLLATSGHDNNLSGLREATWALSSKKKELQKELEALRTSQKDVRTTLKLIDKGVLRADETDAEILLHQAIQNEMRSEIETINSSLQNARKDSTVNAERMKDLAAQKLRLRRLSWEGDFSILSAEDQDVVRGILPLVQARAKDVAKDVAERIQCLESALALNALVAQKPVAAALSLHLSSHGNALGSVGDGWLFQLNPAVNRSKQYTHIRPILKKAAKGHTLDYADLLGGDGRKQWFNYFPDQPVLGGELTALASLPGFTLASLSDLRSRWGTPYDTIDRVDGERVTVQASLVQDMILALDAAELPEAPYKAVSGFSTLLGRANFLRQGELFPEQKAAGSLVQVYQDQQYSLVWVDSLGRFRLPGLADKKHSFGKAIIEGYRFEPGSNRATWAIDKAETGKDRYRVKLNKGQAETDLIMFGCAQTTLFQLQDARSLNPLTRINLIDAKTETDPLRYWFSRIDTKKSSLCSLFLEPATRIKVTLSDTVLERKMLLLGNTPDEMFGQGFLSADTPAIYDTALQAAQDMVNLVGPRVEILESHSIVNQRIRFLLERGQKELRSALEAKERLEHSSADRHARASLATITRVYNDVERTQKDVLGGVLFYIALFVPFAFCLERLLFAHASIHKRIASFLGLLAAVIAIIYTVHPAFQLTYSPMVVILAFFILGLSFLVSMILFVRFEQEMKDMQRRAMVSKDQAISLWGAFVAAFSIGVTNLRRRKVRTALTCITLVILTYTLLNFTAVRHSLDQGALKFATTAAYDGVMLKALEWKSLPRNLADDIRSFVPNSGSIARRVWWETHDKTRPPTVAVSLGEKTTLASGLIGLDPEEVTLSGHGRMLVSGSWFDPGSSAHEILLSEAMAKDLGIDSLSSETIVTLWGNPFAVRGIFQGKTHDQITDLDREPLTPVIYPNETSSELSEAEAEAAESGQDIMNMGSRYQHISGDRTIILPAATLLDLGGSLKSLAIIPKPGLDHSNLSATLADRYQLLLFHGSAGSTWLHYSSSALSYSGMGNILIPSVIAILIVLNTMIGSVVERKREIAVYTSVGLAPPHVSSLFIAEAMAFGIISAVTGYLAAQIAAHFLAETALWAGMTANYSSLAGIGAMLTVMLVVLLSVIYPSRVASRIAIPDVTRTWSLPQPEGSTLVVTLPFLIKLHEQECAGGFLAEYYQAHADISHGLFSTDGLDVEFACPLNPPAADHPDCFNISFRAWLAPFDFGIRQRVNIISCPSPDYPGFLEMRITLTREAGEKNVWLRLCRAFLNDLRKQLLIWRSLDAEEKSRFERDLQARMENASNGARS